MNTILVPIDFSKCSHSASVFALEIAKVFHSEIILFHAFHIPVPPPDSVVEPIPYSVLEKENKHALERFATQLKNEYPSDVAIKTAVSEGFAVDEIVAYADKNKPRLIVMGTEGASGFKKYFFGSNTASVIGKSNTPLLLVPEKAKFKGFSKIAFAVDLHDISNNDILSPLVELATLFGSSIKFFSVKKEVKGPLSGNEAFEKLNLDKVFSKVPHSFHLAKDESIIHAIDDFIKDSHADLIVTIPQEHNVLDILLNKSITRDLAFHTKVPLLSIPDKKK